MRWPWRIDSCSACLADSAVVVMKPNLIAPIMLRAPGSWRMRTLVVPSATAFQSTDAASTPSLRRSSRIDFVAGGFEVSDAALDHQGGDDRLVTSVGSSQWG